MNLSLLDPFNTPHLPDRIESTIRFPFQASTNHNTAPPPTRHDVVVHDDDDDDADIHPPQKLKSITTTTTSTTSSSTTNSVTPSLSSVAVLSMVQKCVHVSFDSQGQFLVAIHYDPTHHTLLVPIYDFTSRTMSSYCHLDLLSFQKTNKEDAQQHQQDDDDDDDDNFKKKKKHKKKKDHPQGGNTIIRNTMTHWKDHHEDKKNVLFTSSWSKNSKSLLISEKGSNYLFFIHATHSYGSILASCITTATTLPSSSSSSSLNPTNNRTHTTSSNTATRYHKNNKSIQNIEKTKRKHYNQTLPKNTNTTITTRNEIDSITGYNYQDEYEEKDPSMIHPSSLNNCHHRTSPMHTCYSTQTHSKYHVEDNMLQYTQSMTLLDPLKQQSSSTTQQQQQQQQDRYHILAYTLPIPSSGCVQIHPEDENRGLTCLEDGSLLLFSLPTATTTASSSNNNHPHPLYEYLHYNPPPQQQQHHHDDENNIISIQSSSYHITCATFANHGEIIYAVTTCSRILAYYTHTISTLSTTTTKSINTRNQKKPNVIIKIPENPNIQQIVTSHHNNGKYIVLQSNSSDGILRLYTFDSIWNHENENHYHHHDNNNNNRDSHHHHQQQQQQQQQNDNETTHNNHNFLMDLTTPSTTKDVSLSTIIHDNMTTATTITINKPTPIVQPIQIFQDEMFKLKLPWIDCDFSNDDEYFIAGYNKTTNTAATVTTNTFPNTNSTHGGTYEIYIWNVMTGQRITQLYGIPGVFLTSLSYHPTRPFIAVGTSDGIIDIWGPKLDWKAFAPDFQALERNVVYQEREDEFDVVIIDSNDDDNKNRKRKGNKKKNKNKKQNQNMDTMMMNSLLNEVNNPVEEEEIVDIMNLEPIHRNNYRPFYFDVAICSPKQSKKRPVGDH